MKRIFFVLLFIFISSCSQDGSKITYREGEPKIEKNYRLKPSYMKGDYVKTEDNRVVRDLNKQNKNKPYMEDDFENVEYETETEIDWKNTKVVTVQPGDSLSGIAKKHGYDIKSIARINNIRPPYGVRTGQKIKIPTKNDQTSGQAKQEVYVVKPGDNLYRIAHKNNVNFTDLVKNNNLKKPYDLSAGQKLIITLKTSEGNAQNSREIEKPKPSREEPRLERTNDSGKSNIHERGSGSESSRPIAGTGSGFVWPVEGEIIRDFNKQLNGNSDDSIGIGVPQGTKIKSIAAGKIAYAGSELERLGKIIIIKHENGWISVYGHCETIQVKVEDVVQKGQIIGTVGKTGNIAEPQLYFSLRKGKIAVDPLKYLPKMDK
ncbi:hypothetical protein FACS1894152_4570 [Bacilli bacterium]|nr:hypothetical protein FACS1894152_4570 [Bacilli bacterium]